MLLGNRVNAGAALLCMASLLDGCSNAKLLNKSQAPEDASPPRAEASVPHVRRRVRGVRIDVPEFPGEWETFPDGDGRGSVIPVDPETQMVRPAWEPCSWGTPGCSIQGPPNWYVGRDSPVLTTTIDETIRKGADGKLRMRFHRLHEPEDWGPTTRYDFFIEQLESGHIDSASIYRSSPLQGQQGPTNQFAQMNFNDKGAMYTFKDRSKKIATRLWHDWNDAEPGFWEEHVVTDPFTLEGGTDYIGDTHIFTNVQGERKRSVRAFDRSFGDAIVPTYKGEPTPTFGRAFPIESGAFINNDGPGVVFMANNGALGEVLRPHPPGSSIRAFRVHRDVGLLAWTEYSAADKSVRIWKSPLTTRSADVRPELVTRLLTYNDRWETFGGTFAGSGGYAVTIPELDTLLVTRLSDGMSWPLKIGMAAKSQRDPKLVPMIAQEVLWADERDVYAMLGCYNDPFRDVVNQRVVHFRMADLGPPTLPPRRD
jgi:hypothetical protein